MDGGMEGLGVLVFLRRDGIAAVRSSVALLLRDGPTRSLGV
jgi:hypothetical protein